MRLVGVGAQADVEGYEDRYYSGRRPNGIYIPRFRNVTEDADGYVRGYGYQGGISRAGWKQGAMTPGAVGADIRQNASQLGPWMAFIAGFGEVLPNPDNRVTLHATRMDKWGIPIPHIEYAIGKNEQTMIKQILADGKAMLEAAGGKVVAQADASATPGLGIHEMGTARMGRDPKTSVLNGFNQAHEVPNLFVTDGAQMASSACQNPSLTYMALTARACAAAVSMLREGKL